MMNLETRKPGREISVFFFMASWPPDQNASLSSCFPDSSFAILHERADPEHAHKRKGRVNLETRNPGDQNSILFFMASWLPDSIPFLLPD
jgi:hypothetical protein